MNTKLSSIFIGAILGGIVFLLAINLIGYTAAIVLPSSISTWAKEHSVTAIVLFVWDMLIIQLLGIGILAALSTYILLKISSFNWLYVAIGFVLTETTFSYSWLFSSSFPENLPSFSYIQFTPHFIVVSFCVFLAASFGAKSQKSLTSC
ncbi:hypothetical protein GCM10011613_18850 [Cellvibrio zantedeschiae]|uniref:Uncharacterized protein n=1 Tax=Cellvibrio zantedeschiae TaxID=1237077 RepID=A0ABQ3B208_9GAMM|nr:hypothetical protein [Cellvibrio zantedeschiae]GGY73802.1 hypothetical protein GCM10011613_18850 [Cellvibrio zantedeschiae]